MSRRLEEMRKDYKEILDLDYEGNFNDSMQLKRLFFEKHVKLLIEQAEQAERALEFYADKGIYESEHVEAEDCRGSMVLRNIGSPLARDWGEKARKTLRRDTLK